MYSTQFYNSWKKDTQAENPIKNEVSFKTNFSVALSRKTAGGEEKSIGCSC